MSSYPVTGLIIQMSRTMKTLTIFDLDCCGVITKSFAAFSCIKSNSIHCASWKLPLNGRTDQRHLR